jgi:PPM family protein phosphatase
MENFTQFIYEIAARTDKGVQRTTNEDSLSLPVIPECDAAFLLADGMGGLRAGELASGTALQAIESVLQTEIVSSRAPLPVLMAMAIGKANDAVNALAPPSAGVEEGAELPTQKPGESALMGTTVIIGLVQEGKLYLAHAGDSRVYRLRGGVLDRLTEDHSYVQEQIRAGNMTEEEARKSKFRNIITRAVGIADSVEPEVRTETLRVGDLILACSDGLTTMLTDSEILSLIKATKFTNATIDRQVELLIEATNKRGGHDNTTICLLRVSEKSEKSEKTEKDVKSAKSVAPPEIASLTPEAPVTSESSLMSESSLTPDSMPVKDEWDEPNMGATTKKPNTGGAGCLSLVLTMFAVIGVAALLGMLSVVFFPKAQAVVATRLGAPAIPSPMNPLGLNDFSFLEYEKPRPFGSDLLVRGDILSYTQGAGLFCVLPSTGRLVCLNKEGGLLNQRVLYNIPIKPSKDKVNAYEVYTATDPAGNIYVSLPYAKFIQKIGPDGRVLATFTGFNRPEAIAVDEEGNVYVADNERLKKILARRGEQKAIAPTPVPILTYASPTPRPSTLPARPRK